MSRRFIRGRQTTMSDSQPRYYDVILVISLALFSWSANAYEFKSQLTKETWEKIQQLGDISGEVDATMQQYNGGIADNCRDQLPQQNYRAGLDKKLSFYRGKLEYDEKLLQSDLLKCGTSKPCKEECRTKYGHDMDACISNANEYIPGLKQAAVKNLKEYMDSCTSGDIATGDESQGGKKKSHIEEEQEYKEQGDQYHW